MHPWMKRAQRIKRNVEHGTIAKFLRETSPQELWMLTPLLWHHAMPESIKADYVLLASDAGLRCLYDSCANANFVPMLALLLERWRRVAPEQVDEVLSECRSILLHARARSCTNVV